MLRMRDAEVGRRGKWEEGQCVSERRGEGGGERGMKRARRLAA